jgi:hypothetical protein
MSVPDVPTAKLPRSETRTDKLTPKVRKAVHAMVWDGLPYDQAAKVAGMHVAAMRNALGRPHVMALLKHERQVLRGSAAARNIHRLCEIRDAANNMPAVQAIKVLEELGDDYQRAGSGAAAPSPGVVIKMVTLVQAVPGAASHSLPSPVVIDGKAAVTEQIAATPSVSDTAD